MLAKQTTRRVAVFDGLTCDLLDLTASVKGGRAARFAMLASCCSCCCSCGARSNYGED